MKAHASPAFIGSPRNAPKIKSNVMESTVKIAMRTNAFAVLSHLESKWNKQLNSNP